MMKEDNKLIHWNYFLAFDTDAEKLSRYIEFTKNNFKAYSIEMVRLLLSASSEVDVVAKLLCNKLSPNEKPENMDDYRNILDKKLPIKEMKIQIRRYGLELIPWANWKDDKNPDWWKGYNSVKHYRDKNFHRANLENTLNSISGLYCLLLYYYKDEAQNGDLIPYPNLFLVGGKFSVNWGGNRNGNCLYYNFPKKN